MAAFAQYGSDSDDSNNSGGDDARAPAEFVLQPISKAPIGDKTSDLLGIDVISAPRQPHGEDRLNPGQIGLGLASGALSIPGADSTALGG